MNDDLDCAVNAILLEQKRLNAAVRVLFRLISYQRNFNEVLMDHLFGKKVSRKALIERTNAIEGTNRDRADYFDGFAAAVLKEIEKMEDNKDER